MDTLSSIEDSDGDCSSMLSDDLGHILFSEDELDDPAPGYEQDRIGYSGTGAWRPSVADEVDEMKVKESTEHDPHTRTPRASDQPQDGNLHWRDNSKSEAARARRTSTPSCLTLTPPCAPGRVMDSNDLWPRTDPLSASNRDDVAQSSSYRRYSIDGVIRAPGTARASQSSARLTHRASDPDCLPPRGVLAASAVHAPADTERKAADMPATRQQTPTVTCKVIVVGNAKCGKSSIISRFVNDSFSHEYVSTVGADYAMKDVELEDGRLVRLTPSPTCPHSERTSPGGCDMPRTSPRSVDA